MFFVVRYLFIMLLESSIQISRQFVKGICDSFDKLRTGFDCGDN
jgi:hypothetical protein